MSAETSAKMRFCAAIAALASSSALACGVCVEDRIAATYDYAVVSEAAARHHVVVFAAVEGSGVPARASRALKDAAAKVKGVDRGTVRSSESPRALSFALDPRSATPQAALAAIQRAPRAASVRLTLIRVVR
jgi:hypothetical protein